MPEPEATILLAAIHGLVAHRPHAVPVLRSTLRQLLDDAAAAAPSAARMTSPPRTVARRASTDGDAGSWQAMQSRVRAAMQAEAIDWPTLSRRLGFGPTTLRGAVGRRHPPSSRITAALQGWLDAPGAPVVAPNGPFHSNGGHPAAERDAAD